MSAVTTALAAQVNEHHRQAYGHAAKAIEHARRAGELLIQAKSEIPHGGWLPWLQDNCEVGEREAQRYMRLAARWDRLKSDTVSDLSLRGALNQLAGQHDKDASDDDDRYPQFVAGHSEFCYIKVNKFLIFMVSESAKHPGFWYLADQVHNTVTCRPCKPEGIREALRQDLRISGGPGCIVRWELEPVEYLFDGVAA